MTYRDLPLALLQHLGFTLASVFVGFVLGVLFGILLSRLPKNLSKLILPILSIFNTIPGVVFVGLLFLVLGMQPITVLIALSIYATFPVLKNTYAGLSSVEPQYIEAAKGCGMSRIQSLVRVELPLAMPVIIAGVRMAAIYTVSWAVLASMISLGGLGDFVYQGTSSNNNTLILLGAIPAAILALVFNITSNPDINPRLKGFRPNGHIIRQIYSVGVPTIVLNSISSIMTFGMNLILVGFSSTAVAVFTV